MSANPLVESESKSLSVPDSFGYHELHYSPRDVCSVASSNPCGGNSENLSRDVFGLPHLVADLSSIGHGLYAVSYTHLTLPTILLV